ALISYICGGVLLVSNIFVKENGLNRLWVFTVLLGYCFNFFGWVVCLVLGGGWGGWEDGINGGGGDFFLYKFLSFTCGFFDGAALTTLVVIRKPKYRVLGAMSMPILVVILALGMMLGSGISTLPPILDSYWRPIHVSIATLAYGVCLFSFGLAFAYLLKDGIRFEGVALWAGLYGLLTFVMLGYGTASAFEVFRGEYTVNLLLEKNSLPLRAALP